MDIKERKFLIAVDGSSHSLNAVGYAAQYCAPAGIKVNLLHIIPPAPETLLDLGKEYFSKNIMLALGSTAIDVRRPESIAGIC